MRYRVAWQNIHTRDRGHGITVDDRSLVALWLDAARREAPLFIYWIEEFE